ncbi:MAG: hypothetical protein NC338_01875 [Firmicutes bacterium]|nr:hypothetical protein [Bacillota bacterium]MCM1401350.1 hypothetical protein [Bacteroides sp.]
MATGIGSVKRSENELLCTKCKLNQKIGHSHPREAKKLTANATFEIQQADLQQITRNATDTKHQKDIKMVGY